MKKVILEQTSKTRLNMQDAEEHTYVSFKMSIGKQNLLAREKSDVTVFLGETMTRKSVAGKCIWNYLSWDEGMKWSLANIYRLRIFTGNKYL